MVRLTTGESVGDATLLPLTGLDWRVHGGSIPASVAVYECVSGERGDITRRAANLVWKIENSLHRQGWPTDVIIGSEAELSKSHSVSREVVREAVRIGELHGSFRMQRGRGGGVMACRPDLEDVSRHIAEYMFCSGVTLAHLRHACDLLEPEVLAHAAQNGKGAVWRAPDQHLGSVARHLSFRQAILDQLTDPVLSLIWNVSTWLAIVLTPGGKPDNCAADHDLRRYEQEVMTAVQAGDAAAASRLRARCSGGASFLDLPLASAGETGPTGDALPDYMANRSSQIARTLMNAVRQLDCGERLGSEWELCSGMNAARPVVRQALRLLEDYGLVEARRGRAGGIFTSQQKRGAILRLAFPYLAANDVQPHRLLPLLWKMNIANVRLAGDRAKDFTSHERDLQLRRARSKADQTPRPARFIGIQQVISAIGQNEMLDILQCILVGYTTRAYPPSRIPKPMSDMVLEQAWDVAQAVIRGETEWAQTLQDECQRGITRIWQTSASENCSSPYVRRGHEGRPGDLQG